MNTLRWLEASLIVLAVVACSCIPILSDDSNRRGPEDFEVVGTLTRTLPDCSTTYGLTNVGDPAPSCYKCSKFQTGSTSAPLAFVLSALIESNTCDQPLGLGSTPIGFSSTETGDAQVHMFDWNEPKSFAAWKDLGTGTWTGDEYIGTVSAAGLSDPVTRAESLALEMSWSVDSKLSRTLEVCPGYTGGETEVSYSWLGDGACDAALDCGVYSFDGGDCGDTAIGGDDDDSSPPPVCDDDGLEENDVRESASNLPGGSVEAMVACPLDPDFFMLPVQTGQNLQVDVTFSHGAGDIDARLFDQDGNEVGQGGSTDDNETIWWTADAAGPVYIEVFLFDQFGSNTYDLRAYAQ